MDPERTRDSSEAQLRAVKLVHTVAWTFFVACIVGIPIAAWQRRFDAAFALIGIVALEVLVLAFNGWHCPLTDVAARYTDARHPKFDIYLPTWVARYNKEIFGPLYVMAVLFTVAMWYRTR